MILIFRRQSDNVRLGFEREPTQKCSVNFVIFFDFTLISLIKQFSMMDDDPIKVLKCRNTSQFLGFSNNIWTQISILTEDFFKIKSYQWVYVGQKCKIKRNSIFIPIKTKLS